MLIRFILLLLSFQLGLNCLHAQKFGPLTSSLSEEVINKASSELLKPTTLRQAYYASKILKKLKSPQFQCGCADIANLSSSQPYDIFASIELSKVCNCNPVSIADKTTQLLSTYLKSDQLGTYVDAALALLALDKPVSLDDLLSSLRPYSLSNGLFKSSFQDDSIESIENSERVIELLFAFAEKGKTSADIKDFSDRFVNLLSSDNDEPSNPALLYPVSFLLDKKPKLSSGALSSMGDLLISQVLGNNFQWAYYSLQSVNILSEYKSGPVFVQLEQSSFAYSQPNKLIQFLVTNIIGAPIKLQGIEIKSLRHSADSEVIYRGPADGNTFDVSSLNLRSGRYIVDLSISTEERSNPINTKKYFVVKDTVLITSVYAGLTDSKHSSIADLKSISHEKELSNIDGTALDNDVFHVGFTLSSQSKSGLLKPHQSLVRFHHVESGTDTYFNAKGRVASSSDNAELSYRSVISLADEIETFLYLSGEYHVEILVGDASYENSIQYVLGLVTFKFPPKPSTESPLYTKSLLHTSDNTLSALPEIFHQMRPPAKRASQIMSTLFTALVGFVGVIYVLYVLRNTSNFNRLSHISVLLFVITLLAVSGLYLGYWFALPGFSFYQTIKYMFFLLPTIYFVGRFALATIATERKNKEILEKKSK